MINNVEKKKIKNEHVKEFIYMEIFCTQITELGKLSDKIENLILSYGNEKIY